MATPPQPDAPAAGAASPTAAPLCNSDVRDQQQSQSQSQSHTAKEAAEDARQEQQQQQPASEAPPPSRSDQQRQDGLEVAKQRAERPTSIVPPYWQHARQASRASVSSLGPVGITLEDNTREDEESGLKSPLWARHVDIDDFVRIEGDIKGLGGYVVWLVKVATLDGGSIILRKRYSEFEALREQLSATFPHAGTSLPKLPPKSVLYKYQPSFLEKRRVGLAYFLNCILLNPEFAGSPAVREFIFS